MPLVLVLDERRVPIDRAMSVGADKICDVIVSGLAAKHARLEPGDEWTVVRAEGDGEVVVNDVRVANGEARALLPGDRIQFGPTIAKVAYEETNVPMGTAELALAAVNRVRDAPRIVVVSGKKLGAHFDLVDEGKPLRAGRGRDCDWVIDEDTLSRAHVRFVMRVGRVLVRDLDSARGTFLGAARLEPQKDTTWTPSVSLRCGAIVLSLVAPTALDEAIADVLEHTPAILEQRKVDGPVESARAEKRAAPIASAAVASAPRDEDRALRVKIVVSIGALFIAGCVAVLLWVLGVFSR